MFHVTSPTKVRGNFVHMNSNIFHQMGPTCARTETGLIRRNAEMDDLLTNVIDDMNECRSLPFQRRRFLIDNHPSPSLLLRHCVLSFSHIHTGDRFDH